MIDIKRFDQKDENYLDRYKNNLLSRGGKAEQVDQLISLNQQRKQTIVRFEELKAYQNKVSQQIGELKKKKEDASALLNEMQILSQKLKDLEKEVQQEENKLNDFILTLPNHLHSSVPIGESAEDNQVVRDWGTAPQMNFTPKDHEELGKALGIIDLERASKVAGARFTFLVGWGSRLERALIQFMMDLHSQHHGYKEIIPPFMVNTNSFIGVGQFPKFKEDVFHLENTDYYMIPTAEVPVTNYYREEILPESMLPQYFVAYSPCFRSEAGSYGRDTKGLIRQHQFNKVEILKFVHPDQSYEEHEKLTRDAETVLQKLNLHYRVVNLCSRDIGFSAAKCYDLEVWLPSQQQYREISSCSNFEDFQARRAQIRFRPQGGGKPQFVHTLNGSGLAVGRTLVAILENYQNADGTITIPEVLRPYMGGQDRITL